MALVLYPGEGANNPFQKSAAHRCLESGQASQLHGTWPCRSVYGSKFLAMPCNWQAVHHSKGQVPGAVCKAVMAAASMSLLPGCVLGVEQGRPIYSAQRKSRLHVCSHSGPRIHTSSRDQRQDLLQVALLLRSEEDIRSCSLVWGQRRPLLFTG